MNAEQVTVTGTVLDTQTNHSSLFSMQFDVTEGRVINATCDSTTVLNITHFSGAIANLRLGTTPVAAPHAFTAYLGSVTCPQVSQEFVSPDGQLILESNGSLFQPNAIVFDGSLGSTWWIEAAKVQIASVPEPSTAPLLLLGIILGMGAMMERRRIKQSEVRP